MLTIGLYFATSTFGLRFVIRGLSNRVPGRGTDSAAHLERFSGIDDQSQVIVCELVFVRAKLYLKAPEFAL